MKKNELNTVLKDLGAGLILRRSTPADAQSLAAFNAMIHSEDPDKPEERIAAWTQDLLARPHPTFHPGLFTVVEERATGRIVSSINTIPQTWAYEGISFEVGRPELVGTLPEFRNRGLVRAQFEVIHQWGAERGEMLQAITGIPYYYKQFGYEMALDLGGGRVGFEPLLPKLEEGESERFAIRSAAEADVPFLIKVDAHANRRRLITAHWDARLWRYEIGGKSKDNINRYEVCVIETLEGEPVGYLVHPWFNWSTGLVAVEFELKPGISWLDVTPAVARYLLATGQAYARQEGEAAPGAYGFWLGVTHPAYDVLGDALPRIREPYAWYLRVPDLTDFIRHITPVLEKRLADSIAVGHSGELLISFYRDGLKLFFERGILTGVETWKPVPRAHVDVAFPDQTFLQLLFGYRSLDELEDAFADCWENSARVRTLLAILFPKRGSRVMAVA